MSNPLISIIIPNYNRAHLIGETLDSVLAQTYTHWECIIVDDGSTDNSKEVIQKYVNKDARFQLHDRPTDRPKGANACRNYGFELSKGGFINWLDSDDLFSNDKLESQIKEAIESKEPNVVITSKWDFFTDLSQVGSIKPLDIYKDFKCGYELIVEFGKTKHLFPPHSYLMSKSIIKKSGLWNEYLKINQDGEFFVRVLLNTNEVLHAKNGISHFRSHNSERTSTYSSDQKIEHAINSWKLIKAYLDIYNSSNKHNKYIEYAKQYLYAKIMEQNSKYIYRNFFFFKNQIFKYSKLSQIIIKLRNSFISKHK